MSLFPKKVEYPFKLWMLLWPLNSRYRRSLHSHCMIPYQLYKEQCRSPSVCAVLEDTPPEES